MSAKTDSAATRRVRDGFVIPDDELWVFGYGSLMWDPCFAHDHSSPALLRGYHRAFCVYSVRYRGTHEKPGLVLGLNNGGACRGMAFRVPAAQVAGAVDDLWAREMPRALYVPRSVRVMLVDKTVDALAFVANRQHEHYVGKLPLDDTARIISGCSGIRGPNADYLCNTLRHLDELGVRDLALRKIYRRVLALQSA
ncbi:MAG: gamma-glutamylcyclotransferase [Burkholderiales bacterium]